LILVLTSDSASHYEVCETAKEGAKECANYNIIGFAFRKIGASIDILGALITAAATVAIAWFTYTLRRSTDQLRESGEKQIDISRQMSEIAERQLTIAGLQTDIQKKQHAIGRLQFIAAHRPRLIIRHVSLAADHSQVSTVILMGHDADANGGLSVVNAGGSSAEIVHATYKIYFSKTGLPARSPLMYEKTSILLEKETIIKRGECRVIELWGKVDLGPLDSTGLRNIHQFDQEGWVVYIMGQIRYQDDGGADHFMGFCRERGSDGRFRAVKDDLDYEYED